jgi:hypothetical protein
VAGLDEVQVRCGGVAEAGLGAGGQQRDPGPEQLRGGLGEGGGVSGGHGLVCAQDAGQVAQLVWVGWRGVAGWCLRGWPFVAVEGAGFAVERAG